MHYAYIYILLIKGRVCAGVVIAAEIDALESR